MKIKFSYLIGKSFFCVLGTVFLSPTGLNSWFFYRPICHLCKLHSYTGVEEFCVDEHPRLTGLDKLAKLPSVFKKNGCVTAGNASGISDGAATVILATEEACQEHGFQPLARIRGYAVSGLFVCG